MYQRTLSTGEITQDYYAHARKYGGTGLSTVGLVFQPAANYNGTSILGWNGWDGLAYASSNATLTININSINDAPS